jgi:sulfate transport system permease protein
MAGARGLALKRPSALPGFGLALGFTLTYLSLIVLIPLAALVLKAASLGFSGLWDIVTTPRALAALRVSFVTSFIAAVINVIFGVIVAWVLIRYRFPGRRLLDAIVDLPFALPTAVAGIALTAIYARNGWVGSLLDPLGIKIAYTPWGIGVALVFIGLPFVVRTVQPVFRVMLPALMPAILTGFALAFARAVGEYGSVIFIAGNIPFVSEIAPLLIVIKLEEFSYAQATAIAAAMLTIAFTVILLINVIQAWQRRRFGT